MLRTYMKVPFQEKDEAKLLGARFDSNEKLWYTEGLIIPFLAKWDVLIDCPFKEKEEAKAKGARFDFDLKRWFIPRGVTDVMSFSKWLPSRSVNTGVSVSSSQSGLPLVQKSTPQSPPVQKSTPQSPRATAAVAPAVSLHIHVKAPAGVDTGSKAAADLLKIKKDIKDSSGLNVADLKELLKSRGVKGVSALSKQELIDKCVEMKILSTVVVLSGAQPSTTAPSKKRKNPDDSSSRVCDPSNIPPDFECPILMEAMIDPVICSDGFSYERAAIENWLRHHETSPKTNEVLSNKKLIPNKTLKAAIITWRETKDR